MLNQTRMLCQGTYYVLLTVSGSDVEIIGLAGAGSTALSSGGSGTVLELLDGCAQFSVEGVNLTGGDSDYGGAFHSLVVGVEASFIDCRLEYNMASLSGGAIYMEDGLLNIEDSSLTGNNAYEYGAAIFLEETDLDISGSTVDSNVAWADGGGLYVESSDVDMTDSLFVDNVAYGDGGGVYLSRRRNAMG